MSNQLSKQIAKQLRDLHFGENWTAVNMKDTLTGVSWQQAITPIHGLNTIATLVFHMNYYVSAALKVLQGGPLDAKDIYSFKHPPIESAEDWTKLLEKTWTEAEALARLIEQMPDEKWWEDFSENKYGNYYRNITGNIEHNHYHLGQIVLIKKMLMEVVTEESNA